MTNGLPAESSEKKPETMPGHNRRRLLAACAIALVCLVLVAGVVAIVIRMAKSSEPYKLSESFIRNNAEIRALVGDDIKFGLIPAGSINTTADEANAEFTLRVRGSAGSTQVTVFAHTAGREWKVLSASYQDRDGTVKTILPRAPSSDPVAQEHLVRGYDLYRKYNFMGAVGEYTKIVQAEPNNSAAYYWRGVSLAKSGADDRAIADLQRSIALDPGRVEAYEYLDWLLARRGEWYTIITQWSNLIQLQPNNSRAYYQRAGAYLRKGDVTGARADAQKACGLGLQDACHSLKKLEK